jgi:hypothetical protein
MIAFYARRGGPIYDYLSDFPREFIETLPCNLYSYQRTQWTMTNTQIAVRPPLQLRVFLSSPGDVTDERALARKVLDYLPKERPFRGRLLIEEVSWDDPGAPTPLAAHLTTQEAIHRHRPKPSEHT